MCSAQVGIPTYVFGGISSGLKGSRPPKLLETRDSMEAVQSRHLQKMLL